MMRFGIRTRIRSILDGPPRPHPDAGTWKHAQETEAQHSAPFWEPFGNPRRQSTSLGERIKNGFLVDVLEHFVGETVEERSQGKRVLDIACGPVSFASQMKGAAALEGVDPLEYPNWVYVQYERRNFKVHVCRLEDLVGQYDLAVCYNALQHFENLEAAAAAIFRLLGPGGQCLIVDYLEIPTDDAHLIFLTKASMDGAFSGAGFQVRSEEQSSRLPGYVEMKGGKPIKLYLGEMTKTE